MPRTLFLVLCFVASLAALQGQTDRTVIPLDGEWRWRLGGEESPDQLSKTGWQRVQVPHTWNSEDATSAQIVRGKGWYVKRFPAISLKANQRAYLNFEAVSLLANVWLNGVQVGTHDNGFSRFRLDVTKHLRDDNDNVLVVLADSTWRSDVPPREGDFALCGGIYRSVSLLITRDVGFDLLDHGGTGIRISTTQLTPQKADVRIQARLRSSRKASANLTLRATLYDRDHRVTAEAALPVTLIPGATDTTLGLSVPAPHAWKGIADPYLYEMTLALIENGEIVDHSTQAIGLRTVALSATEGFLLNGIPYELRGVNLHQDRASKAWVATPADRAEDLRLITDMGATFVRLVHYQHDEDIYTQADRLGLVLWAEHTLVNTIDPGPVFRSRCEEQVRELIAQGFNHPSVVCWGVGNEVQPDKTGAVSLLTDLAALAKAEDSTRFTTLATCFGEDFGAYGLDTLAHNQYHGWYHDQAGDFLPWLEGKLAKGGPIGMSEYGAGAGVHTHSAHPKPLDHSEEYQALFHEIYWKALRQHPEVWCKAVWQMFDAASPTRKEGEDLGVNDKGLVTRDRKTPKDAYYFYQAQWSPRLMAHIASERFTARTEAQTDLKVYSNGEYAEAFQNGVSLGRRRVEDGAARWPGLALAPGVNPIEVVAKRGNETVSTRCEWTLKNP